jgi:acyl-coenzyme A thioesterase PaaI-like protein
VSPAQTGGPAVDGDAAAERVADAARRVGEALVRAGGAVGDHAADLAGRLDRIADEIASLAPPLADRFAQMWTPGAVRAHDPASGAANPVAPPLRLRRGGSGEVLGSVTLGWAYQGPAGYAHGGTAALLLDHVLGLSNAWAGTAGMTAHLELDFHRPVPLDRELSVTARQVAVDGRKMRAAGAISSDEGVHVSAEGLFLAVREGSPPPNTCAFPGDRHR